MIVEKFALQNLNLNVVERKLVWRKMRKKLQSFFTQKQHSSTHSRNTQSLHISKKKNFGKQVLSTQLNFAEQNYHRLAA